MTCLKSGYVAVFAAAAVISLFNGTPTLAQEIRADKAREERNEGPGETPREPAADRLVLNDGSAVNGTVILLADGTLKFKTIWGGEISVQWSSVDRLETHVPVEVTLASGDRVNARIGAGRGGAGTFALDGATLRSASVSRGEIAAINEEEFAPKWAGNANLGLSATSGNKDTQRLLARFAATRRGEDDRISINALALWGRTKDNATNDWELDARKFNGGFKYDYFWSKSFFVFGSTKFESDRFTDLNLRSRIDMGIGRQIFEDDNYNWNVELGLTGVDEDRRRGKDDNYAGSVARSSFSWRITETVRWSSAAEVTKSFDDPDKLLTHAESTLALGIGEGWSMDLSAIWDHDRAPPAGVQRSELQYILSVGYNF